MEWAMGEGGSVLGWGGEVAGVRERGRGEVARGQVCVERLGGVSEAITGGRGGWSERLSHEGVGR